MMMYKNKRSSVLPLSLHRYLHSPPSTSICTSSTTNSVSDQLEQMFQNITCSNDLYMLKHLEIDSQLDIITCILCSEFKKQAPKHLLSAIKSSFGIFEYVEQDPHQIQSQRFRSLK